MSLEDELGDEVGLAAAVAGSSVTEVTRSSHKNLNDSKTAS